MTHCCFWDKQVKMNSHSTLRIKTHLRVIIKLNILTKTYWSGKEEEPDHN